MMKMKVYDLWIIRLLRLSILTLLILICISLVMNLTVSPIEAENPDVKAFCVFEDSERLEMGSVDKD
jgi:hypothetical protein